MSISWKRLLPIGALLACAAAWAQPVDLLRNPRAATPSPHAVAATAFELNADPVARGLTQLQLQLPAGPLALLNRKNFQRRGANSGLWLGSANLREDSLVVLTLHNGMLAGTIIVGTETYEIRPGSTEHVVEKMDMSTFPSCKASPAPPAPKNGTTAQSAAATVIDTADATTASIDLLSVYTPQARTAAGGTTQIETTIQNAVDYANVAFTNSVVGAVYRLARTAEVAYNDSGDIGADLTWVRGDATVASLRDQSGADMVSLIVENGAGYCGIGYVQQSVGSGFAPYAFQVTARSCAVSNLTFAHEHGHNLGMEHDPANGSSPTSASYPWSFGHLVNGVFRTVMSYSSQCPNGCTRVPYYSNPNVANNGYPTGIVDQRDNARTANATTPVVAGFRSAPAGAPPAAPSLLTATAISGSQINLSWTDGSTDEAGFYVERSTDGTNFTQIGSTGANTTTYSSTGLAGATTYYYRVRAYNTAGASAYTNVASTVTLAAAPAAPGSFTGTALYTGSGKKKVFTGIRLNWVDVANNTGYNLERCKVSGRGSSATCTYSAIATPGANDATYTDSGAPALGTGSFRYRIRSFNTVGPSAWVGVSVTAN